MEQDSVEDPCYPRRVSRPGGEEEGLEERPRLIVALTELLAVLLLAVCQHDRWKGRVVLYMGDNQVVVRWLNSRQAKHPLASYLLQVLSAIEACYGFHVHTAYLRTYHNVVADALTRQDAEKVIREAGLESLPKPDGQADADRAQAFKLPAPVKGQMCLFCWSRPPPST